MYDTPVIVIVYNRPKHTLEVLKALREHNIKNIYIFSDAPKRQEDAEAVSLARRLIHSINWTTPKVIERPENFGLARNIVSAVNYVFDEHDRLILLEDDCVPRKFFFDFMEKCLCKYRDNERVFGINGYTVPIPNQLLKGYPYDIYFYPRIGSWGWATWKSTWEYYEPDLLRLCNQIIANNIDITQGGEDIPHNVRKMLSGELKDVWTLNWVLSVYLNRGYYIYPTVSQIINIGLDGTGVHCGKTHHFDNFSADKQIIRFPDNVVLDEDLIDNYNSFFGKSKRKSRVVNTQSIHHDGGSQISCAQRDINPSEGQRKLSIVHINTHDIAGGAAKVAWRLAEAQREAGHRSSVLVGSKKSKSKYSFSFPIEVDTFIQDQCRRKGQLDYEFQGSHLLVSNPVVRSADILHLHNLHGGYFNPFSLSAISHLRTAVWTLHDMQSITGHCAHSFDCEIWQNGCNECPYLGIPYEISVDSSAQLLRDRKLIYDHSYLQIVTPSKWLKNKVERSILRNHPVELIYNGIDTSTFRPYDKKEARRKFGIPADVLVIGAAAHGGALVNYWKGGKYTQAALDALRTKFPDYVFVSIGGSSETSDRPIVNIPHISDETELAQAYSALDIFLYTPIADNCPLVVLETLSCGVPIVTFDTGGIPELVRDGSDGYVSAYKDITALVQALEKLAIQKELRDSFGRNAREWAVSKFDHRIVAEQYESLYQSCLQRNTDKPKEAKFFPLEKVPKVILSKVFTKAENSKRALSCQDETKKTEFGNSPTKHRNKQVTIATSIAPQELDKQKTAIDSWLKLGFGVVSINCAEEIEELQGHFPGVEFVQANRDTRGIHGKPLIYFDDFLDYFSESNCEYCGIVNSDVCLISHTGTISFIQKETKNSLVYGSRIDVDSLEVLDGRFHERGFDFFFFHESLIPCFPSSEFCMGKPWWDYWVPLIAALEGFEIKKLVSPFAYHLRHPCKWNENDFAFFAREIFGYLRPQIAENLNRDTDRDPWAFLGRVFSIGHEHYLEAKGIEDKTKMSIGIIVPCICHFLREKSTLITQSWNESKEGGAQDKEGKYLVSAIVSTYNAERFIRGCLEDLENQSIADRLEIIVVNSGSQQNEEEIVKEFQQNYDNIKYMRTGERETIYKAWNRAIKIASGKYIANANTDDRRRKDAMEIMVEVLERDAEIGLVYADQILTETEGETFENNTSLKELRYLDYTRDLFLKMGWCNIGSQPMWRACIHEEVGLFDESFEVAGDYDFLLRVCEKYKCFHIPQFLGLFYRSGEALTQRKFFRLNQIENPLAKARALLRKGICCIEEKDFSQAMQHLGWSLRLWSSKEAAKQLKIAAEKKGRGALAVADAIEKLPSIYELPGTKSEDSGTKLKLNKGCYSAAGKGIMVSAIVCPDPRFTVRHCLEDMQEQTVADRLEVVVIDRGLGPEDKEAVERFQQKFDSVKRIKVQNTETIYSALNKAVKTTSGRYIALLDNNYRYQINALESMVQALDSDADAAAVYVNEKGDGEGDSRGLFSKDRLLREDFVDLPVLWHRDLHQRLGYFDEAFSCAGGYEFWHRIAREYNFLHLDIELEQCQQHPNYTEDGFDGFISRFETTVVQKCYQYACLNSILIDQKGPTWTPQFSDWCDINIIKKKNYERLTNQIFDPVKKVYDFRDADNAPSLTVIVVAYNRDVELLEHLRTLDNQTEKNFELVVVNNGRAVRQLAEGTNQYSYDLCYVELKSNYGPSLGRNIGAGFSRAPCLAFLDDDAVADKDFVRNITKHFEEYGIYALRGKVLPKKGDCNSDFLDLGSEIVPSTIEPEGNCAFRKDIFFKHSGFDECLFHGEGADLAYRIYKSEKEKIESILYFPDVVVYHDSYVMSHDNVERIVRANTTGKLLTQKDPQIRPYLRFFGSFYSDSKHDVENDYHRLMSNVSFLRKNYPEKAMEWAQKAAALKPTAISCRYIVASLYMELKRYDQAQVIFEKALEQLLKVLKDGELKYLSADFTDSTTVGLCYCDTCLKLAQCYIHQEQYDRAKQIYTELLNNPYLIMSEQQKACIRAEVARAGKTTRVASDKTGNAIVTSLRPHRDRLNNAVTVDKNVCSRVEGVHRSNTVCDVSVVVCTKNRGHLLDQMLTSLKAATDGVSYEVIVIEGDSVDNTRDVLRKHGVRDIYSESKWLGHGRHSWPQLYNFGLSKAYGKWGMYASDDIVFSKGCISEALGTLEKQKPEVGGGIFFYKNAYPTKPDWNEFGIDFTYGPKLLLNYGLLKLDYFRDVGGLDETYEFYCADTDLCYKLYEKDKQLIPLPGCFVTHNNLLDAEKEANQNSSEADIELLLQRWKHFVSAEIPRPRRLMWQEDCLDVFSLPMVLEKIEAGIESFWHGLACFQQGLFDQAKSKFVQAVESQCAHWLVLWYSAKAANECGDKDLAERAAKAVMKLAPDFNGPAALLTQLNDKSKCPASTLAARQKCQLSSAANDSCSKDNLVALIFSKDRAMQLQATIESFLLHCGDNSKIKLHVLYKATNQLHQHQYDRLKEKLSGVLFTKESNFKQQVLAIMNAFEYVLFMVDDNLFVRDFRLADFTASLEKNGDAIGFSLRLGKNTNYCYSRDSKQSLPVFQRADDGILKYDWTEAEFDFGYPLELSSSVYRARDIMLLLEKLEFGNPNVLEDLMAGNARLYAQARANLLCCEYSVTFCNPINKVQSVWNNRVCGDHRYTADRLAEMFENGSEIDVDRYSNFLPYSCHQEVPLHFKQAADRATGSVTEVPGRDDPNYVCSNANCKPQFSIVMANYNNAKYIAQALESVRNQTFNDWELIIVEDGSTDNSVEIIKQFLSDRRIRLIQHEKNRGYTASLKTGIANLRADYFGILDSDDCLLPHAVEMMHAHHVKYPDCGLIYSQFTYCCEDLTPGRIGFCNEIPAGKTSLDANVVSHFKTFKLCDYLKTSGYDENILYAEDIDIVYKMEEVTKLKFVDECLYLYRELPSSLCHSRDKVNISIMSRVKARINAIKRRCTALAGSCDQTFAALFRQSVKEARTKYEDVQQYFVILERLYDNGLLSDLDMPCDMESRDSEDRLLWLVANVSVRFDKLFESLTNQKRAEKQPLVSVYMVTYNAERFIAEAIDSVLAQTYRNFELLIVDDGSTDETRKLVSSYSDERIRYIYKEHKNFASGMNRAIVESKGEYIIGVDSDDFIAPDYIEKMVECARRYPEADYFYPRKLVLVDESANLTGAEWDYLDFSDNSILPAYLFGSGYGPIPNPGSLKRRSMFNRTGLYEELDTVEDFAFLCRNALKINFKRVQEHSAYYYRRHGASNSNKFSPRSQIMARILNSMVSIYPPEVLWPQITSIADPDSRKEQYYRYLMGTFFKLANQNMTRYGRYFREYGVYYKQKLSELAEPGRKVVAGG